MASIHAQRNKRGATWRVMWRTPDGTQRSRNFSTRPEARRFKTTIEGLEQAGRAPDPARGEITLEDWAELVLSCLHLKPKTVEAYGSLLRSRILPTFGGNSTSSGVAPLVCGGSATGRAVGMSDPGADS